MKGVIGRCNKSRYGVLGNPMHFAVIGNKNLFVAASES